MFRSFIDTTVLMFNYGYGPRSQWQERLMDRH